MSKNRIAPLAIDEKIADLVEYLPIWLQHVRLQQESLGTFIFFSVALEFLEALPQKVFRLSIDSPNPEEREMPDFAEELVPSHFLHVFHALLRVESVLVEDRWDDWNASLLALLHVVWLA